MSSVKNSIGMSKKKATGGGWLSHIEKGIRTPPNFIVRVKMPNDTATIATNLSPISQDLLTEQSQSLKSKTPTASQKKRWTVYKNTDSTDVTVNDGRKNLQKYQSLSHCAWTSKYNSSVTSGQPLSEINIPPIEDSLFVDETEVPSYCVFFPYDD
jgi:hypothetical protein